MSKLFEKIANYENQNLFAQADKKKALRQRELRIEGNGNLKEIMRMLAWIEICGRRGHSTSFKVYADGDGGSRWRFNFKNPLFRKIYKQATKDIETSYNETQKDIESFSL